MRPNSMRGVVLLLVLVLALGAVAVAGCGGSDKTTSSSTAAATLAAAADGRTADQIVKESEAKMATVTSAAFNADFGLQIQGDTSKMTDPTAKALLSQGVTLTAQGKSAKTEKAGPVVDMTMSVGIAGQTLEFGMKAAGKKAWIEYQGAWYKVDRKDTKSLEGQVSGSAAPTDQLKSMGIDPSTWGLEYQLVGTESMNGVQVYHVKGTADPQKLADALTKAAEDPKLNKQLGSATGSLGQLGSGLTGSAKQAEALAKTLKDATVDYWIGVDDQYMYKMQLAATMDMSAQKDMQGVSGVSLKGSATMSDFDQPVTVTPPTGAKPFDDFMNQLLGGMMGGTGSMSF
jgi:hypothetical protein